MVIAIDGPAGAGKSTVARELARELGFTYLDSGAMYRSVALLSLRAPQSEPASLARAASIELVSSPSGDPPRVILDGLDVSERIRTPEVSEQASVVAADQGVREVLVAKQRELISAGDWVAEGRDIGTVVAPDAALKVFLTAEPRERARRRAAELGADEDTVIVEQTLRDERDRTRAHSPLRAAQGAVTLDTTGLDVAQVVARIVALARGATHASRDKVDVAKRVTDAYNRRDVDGLFAELATPDFEWHPGLVRALDGGGYRGREGIEKFAADTRENWEELESFPEEFRDLGDRVLVLGRLKGRGKGSGAPVDTPYTGIFDFRGDRIWRSRVYLDRAEGLRAAGLSE